VTRPCTVIVLAKAPAPGRSKTRCSPPCTLEQAADLAAAALHDTLATVAATPAHRRVVVLDGTPGPWLPSGFEVLAQRGNGLDERLAAAFADVGGPAALIGMDTPQVSTHLLVAAQHALTGGDCDAVLGPAEDGGYWLVGLRRPDSSVFSGVPMSTAQTGRVQLTRLLQCGYRVELLPSLRDVDTFVDALDVAATVPGSSFARTVKRLARVTSWPGPATVAAVAS
jgi:rSAM/selenodomain-associated transferase 1